MPGRRQENAERVGGHGVDDEVDRRVRQRIAAEREQDDGQAVIAAVREHHDDEERARHRAVEAERQRHQPRHQPDPDDGHERQRRHPAEVARAERRGDEHVEDQTGRQRVEGDARERPHVRPEHAGDREADGGHDEDRQHVIREDR